MHHDMEKLMVYRFLLKMDAPEHIKQAFETLVAKHNISIGLGTPEAEFGRGDVTYAEIKKMGELYLSGFTAMQVARSFNLSVTRVRQLLIKHNFSKNKNSKHGTAKLLNTVDTRPSPLV